MRSLEHLCLLFALFAVAPAEHWDYRDNGPSTWGKTYPTCNGLQQSPIMLNLEEVFSAPQWLLRTQVMDVQFYNYDTVGAGVFSNNGHSVNLEFNFTNPSKRPRVRVSHASASEDYFLQALHFHWQSEHWIEHENFPLEMHMVHKDSTGDKILVLGYVFAPCARRWSRLFSSRSMEGLDAVADAVQHLTDVGDNVPFMLAPQRLMPSTLNAAGYFTYKGSLTTPPCSEGVTWLVRREPLCAEVWQLETFYQVRDAEHLLMAGNARPLQPRNNRPVYLLTC